MTDKSTGNKLADENDRNLSVQILLTEYTAAKNEIMSLDRATETIMSIYFIASAAILSVLLNILFNQPENSYYTFIFFLVLSILSSAFGLLWLSRLKRIALLNRHKIVTITNNIHLISSNADLFNSDEIISSKLYESLFFLVPSLLFFVLAVIKISPSFISIWVNESIWNGVGTLFFILIALCLLVPLVVNGCRLHSNWTTIIKEQKT